MNNRYTLTVTADENSLHRDPEIRLRQWLKIGLRGFGIRCVTITEADAANGETREDDETTSSTSTNQDAPECE